MNWIVLLSCCLGQTASGFHLEAFRGDVSVIADAPQSKIQLTEDLLLVITVEGPAPVRVNPPATILAAESAPFWRIRRTPPARITPLPQGRERWQLTVRLSPFDAGEAIPLALAPFQIQAGTQLEATIAWPKSGSIEVTTSIPNPDISLLRPITEVEAPPPPQERSPNRVWQWLIIGLLVCGFMVWAIRRIAHRSQQETAVTNAVWALAELRKLTLPKTTTEVGDYLTRLTVILRSYLEFRFPDSAVWQTSAELLANPSLLSVITAEDREKLATLLEKGDYAKFAGAANSPYQLADGKDFSDWAVQWIETLAIGEAG